MLWVISGDCSRREVVLLSSVCDVCYGACKGLLGPLTAAVMSGILKHELSCNVGAVCRHSSVLHMAQPNVPASRQTRVLQDCASSCKGWVSTVAVAVGGGDVGAAARGGTHLVQLQWKEMNEAYASKLSSKYCCSCLFSITSISPGNC